MTVKGCVRVALGAALREPPHGEVRVSPAPLCTRAACGRSGPRAAPGWRVAVVTVSWERVRFLLKIVFFSCHVNLS